MRHGIRSHEQFKAVDTRQQVFGNIARPQARAARKVFTDTRDHGMKKRACATGGVENLHAVGFNLCRDRFGAFAFCYRRQRIFNFYFAGISETVRQSEIAFKDGIHRTHDVVHHRFGGVIDTARFFEFRVVCAQEGFVKMHHGVVLARGVAEVAQDTCHVGTRQQFGKIIHRPSDALVQISPCNVVEQFAQEGVGLG